jgi:hypothetical protein
VQRRLSRRDFVGGAGMIAAGAAAFAARPLPALAAEPRSFSRVIDLTHPFGPDFPTYDGGSNLEMEALVTLAKDGYNMYRWHLVEHTGTHMDAPFHFGGEGAQTAEQIPVERLVVPVAVVDIRAKAADDVDAQLTPDDLAAFEAAHNHDVQPGLARRLHVVRQADFIADRMQHQGTFDHIRKGRVLRVQVDHAPVGLLERPHPAHPDMQWNGSKVGDVDEGVDVVTDEVVDVALGVVAPDRHRTNPVGRELRCVLLIEGLSIDAIRESRQDERPVAQVRQQPRRNRPVVLDQFTLRVLLVLPEYLAEIRELDLWWGLGPGAWGLVLTRQSLRPPASALSPAFLWPLPSGL